MKNRAYVTVRVESPEDFRTHRATKPGYVMFDSDSLTIFATPEVLFALAERGRETLLNGSKQATSLVETDG